MNIYTLHNHNREFFIEGCSIPLNSSKYLQTICAIYGKNKVSAVFSRYHFRMEGNSKSFKPEKIRQIQAGLNDIHIEDLDDVLKKHKENQRLSIREKDALSSLGLMKCEQIKNYSTASDLPPALFQELIIALQAPQNKYGRFFPPLDLAKITGIPGQYVRHGWISHQSGRALEDEERLRIYEEIKSLAPEETARYCELLAKIVVKKHLYYEQPGMNKIKFGMLVPGLKDASGQPRWYRIDDMIDSGWGKFAYRLVPACHQYSQDMPDILLYRSSASLPTAKDSFTSYLNDINVLPPGYLSRNVCKEQELQWLTASTPSPQGGLRPLLITGHSLGAAASQQALLNLKKSGKNLNRNISLELFDSPAIRRQDAKEFAEWYEKQDLDRPLLAFNYYVSKGDPVSLVGDVVSSSYLGRYMKKSAAFVHQMEMTEQGKRKKEISGLGPHAAIYFRGKEGVDFKHTITSIKEYDHKNKGLRLIVNLTKLIFVPILWSTLGVLGGLKRFFFGRRQRDSGLAIVFNKLFTKIFYNSTH